MASRLLTVCSQTMPLPPSLPFIRKGDENALGPSLSFPLINVTDSSTGQPLLTRWDGVQGTPQDLLVDILAHVKVAVSANEDFKVISTSRGITTEVSEIRTKAGYGNKYYRLSGVIEIPPSLLVAGVLSPIEIGTVDHTNRMLRVMKDFEDSVRLIHLVVETGPRFLGFCDRDDCSLTAFRTDPDGTIWQISTTVPSHVQSFNSRTIRLFTMYWGYRLEPVKTPAGEIHTKITLVSQTELNGWMPKFIVHAMIPSVLSEYVRGMEKHLQAKIKDGSAEAFVQGFGLNL